MIYRPKHHKLHPTTKRLLQAHKWIWGEFVWYCKWWGNFIITIFRKLYQFGEFIQIYGVKFIDKHDEFWDRFEDF